MTWMPLGPATGSSLTLFFAGSPAFCFPAATSALRLSSAIRRAFSSSMRWCSAWSFANSSRAFFSTSSLAFRSASALAFLSASSRAYLAASSCSWRAHSSTSAFACLRLLFSALFAFATSSSSSVRAWSSSDFALVQSMDVVVLAVGVVVCMGADMVMRE